jgi:ACS family glucarate transporter-like MFS transporter
MTVMLAAITYLDRVCISVTGSQIQRDLGLDIVQMGSVFSAFYLAYALFEIPTGWWCDKAGSRRILTRIVSWWSAFTVLTGAAFSYPSLLTIRFLFGAGEAGAWPSVARTFSRWFPLEERGRAQGLFFMGAHLAGGLTPLLVTALLNAGFNWRSLFGLFGSVGFVWALAWHRWFRDTPAEHASVSRAERIAIESGMTSASFDKVHGEWRRLLANRTAVCLCLMYFTQAFGGAFYVTWLPTYLASRGLVGTKGAILAGLPLILSAVADIFGGFTTDSLTKRFGLRIGRAGVGGVALAAAGIFTIAGTFMASPVLAAVLISLGGASSNFLLGAAWGTCIDIGRSRAGALSAAMNTSGQVGSLLSPLLVAQVVRHFSNWSAPLYLTGLLFILGSSCWAWIDPTRPVAD